MAWPVRHLPVLQNWDCHGCTNCCRKFIVHVTDEERRRITEQGWESAPELRGVPLFAREGPWWARRHHLTHQPDGACVFLSEQGRCRIHEKFGGDAKPLACRLYPFILVPGGDHWRVGLRYACPSAARNEGRPGTEHQRDLVAYAALLERQERLEGQTIQSTPLQGRQRVDWPDLFAFVDALLEILGATKEPIERRWRKCLALGSMCRQAQFDQVKGKKLSEFLKVLRGEIEASVPTDPRTLEPPTWVGRILFRLTLAHYLREDTGPERGPAGGGRMALLKAASRFVAGRGPVPRLHRLMSETTFERVEEPAGPLSEAAEAVLRRYYVVKIESLQFCGPTNFRMSFWSGLDALALTLPAILWLNRALADQSREVAVTHAISIVDNNFGFNPLLGARRQKLGLAILRFRGELEKLIAWYSR